MKKIKKFDYIVASIYMIALLILYFFWKCEWDPVVTFFGLVIVGTSLLTTILQYKRIRKIQRTFEDNEL